MKILFISAVCLLSVLSVTTDLFAQAETNSAMGWSNGFLKTNGEYVIIDNNIMIKTNSPLNTDEFKQFKWQKHELFKIMNSGSSNAIDMFVERARALSKDYPKWDNGYDDMMIAIEDYDYTGQPDKARSLANELIDGSAPEQYKIRSKDFLNRLNLFGKPITMKFTALDGCEVDLAKMKGKVVLIDFWATWCGPCVKEIPNVKAAYDKFHGQGFEVIGISCDTDKERLNRFLKEKKFFGRNILTANHKRRINLPKLLGLMESRTCFWWVKKAFCVLTMCGQAINTTPKATQPAWKKKFPNCWRNNTLCYRQISN